MDLRRPALAVAPDLLGCVLRGGGIALRLTEVEAYGGHDDPASHAFRGPTPRTEVMFGPPGRLYVYRSMGLHHCVNIVCGAPGTAAAVLLRAGEVVDGLDLARTRRGDVADTRLASGPGNLGRALGVTTATSGQVLGEDGWSLTDGCGETVVCQGPRVGVSRAADRPWRLWLPDEPTVSAYRRHTRAVSS